MGVSLAITFVGFATIPTSLSSENLVRDGRRVTDPQELSEMYEEKRRNSEGMKMLIAGLVLIAYGFLVIIVLNA